MNSVHIDAVDLNLLRLFDAVYRTRNVSRAAEALGLTQPAASHGLTRLRLLLGDALFTRAPGGVAPTPRAERLAVSVQSALTLLQQALVEPERFDPAASRKLFRIHMSDIGEGRFLPALMARLRELSPGVRVETMPLAAGDIADALLEALQELDYVAVCTHADTLRILQLLNLEDRLRLTTEHFMVLPAIVRATDLAVVMPRNIARGFAEEGHYAIVEPPFPLRDFSVSLHWSKRFEADPGNRWLRQVIVTLFSEKA